MVGPYVTAGAVAGFDFAGVVKQVGPEATKCDIRVGDRVCTAILGMNAHDPTVGAFAEYTAAVEWILLKLLPSLSFEEDAWLGISFMTTGLALFKCLGLPGRPLEPSTQSLPVLVFGGSSSTGTAAIQLLKLAGLSLSRLVRHTTSTSSSHTTPVPSLTTRHPGARQISGSTPRTDSAMAVDCISTTASMQFCYQALGRAGGKYTALEPYNEAVAQTRKVIKPDWIMGPQFLGKEIAWPEPH